MLDSLVDLISSSNWTYLVIVVIAYLDAIIPIVPSETAVIAAGVLAGTGDLVALARHHCRRYGAFAGQHCVLAGPEVRSADFEVGVPGREGAEATRVGRTGA